MLVYAKVGGPPDNWKSLIIRKDGVKTDSAVVEVDVLGCWAIVEEIFQGGIIKTKIYGNWSIEERPDQIDMEVARRIRNDLIKDGLDAQDPDPNPPCKVNDAAPGNVGGHDSIYGAQQNDPGDSDPPVIWPDGYPVYVRDVKWHSDPVPYVTFTVDPDLFPVQHAVDEFARNMVAAATAGLISFKSMVDAVLDDAEWNAIMKDMPYKEEDDAEA